MRVALATKISTAMCGVLALAIASCVVAIASAYRFESFQTTLVEENLASVRAAEELEIALLEQRGHVSLYMLDGGNEHWLQELEGYRHNFDKWLAIAQETARVSEERDILSELDTVHAEYAKTRDEAVRLYKLGDVEQAKQLLLHDTAALHKKAYDLCEEFIATNQSLVLATSNSVRLQVESTTLVVTVLLAVTLILGVSLLWLFFHGVMGPLRRISLDMRAAAGEGHGDPLPSRPDEMRELGRYVQVLMSSAAEVRSDLEHSRVQLAHADRLAVVGKLAASVAHEIRNPLTSVRMWLYSLRRSVSQQRDVQEKFDTISNEITRLESIVREFLEFARPPELKRVLHPIVPIVEKTLELLRYQIEGQHICVVRQFEPDLSTPLVDIEQMQQVFFNLLNNAIEAMPGGGEIRISISQARHSGRNMLAVRIGDTGPGIPADVRQHMFEPFYTAKEDGNGLGLCITASIMARHTGVLELESSSPEGTNWTVWIPIP